ncbi:hypothetical protein [Allonocardiopsis opalescens]|uniref:Uncharacterized protein n=1 Tax=Allonocardiopsis opalescens TaxID=1144618 RepID=A0A2T0QFM1_9ACTN|nr:hypothetical protein [Allonocardiopsis opalescens]PRY02734.1 hypothetical protein CLV72_1011338 [Allonocardiopsis opalescens]
MELPPHPRDPRPACASATQEQPAADLRTGYGIGEATALAVTADAAEIATGNRRCDRLDHHARALAHVGAAGAQHHRPPGNRRRRRGQRPGRAPPPDRRPNPTAGSFAMPTTDRRITSIGLISFGYLHAPAPRADIRRRLRRPTVDLGIPVTSRTSRHASEPT